jgi:hypothetical protein
MPQERLNYPSILSIENITKSLSHEDTVKQQTTIKYGGEKYYRGESGSVLIKT